MFFTKSKPASHETRILQHLKKCGNYGEYNYNLAKQSVGGLDWRKSISKLRKDGYIITHIQIARTTHKYYLNLEEKS